MVAAFGLEAIVLSEEYGSVVSPERLAETLAANPEVKGVFIQASETSTGAAHDVEAMAKIIAGTEAIFIRIQLDSAESPWIAHAQRSTIVEVQDEPLPFRVAPMTGVLEPVDGIDSIHIEHTGHAEAQSDPRTGGVEQ